MKTSQGEPFEWDTEDDDADFKSRRIYRARRAKPATKRRKRHAHCAKLLC